MKAAIYVRVSTDEQAKEGYSIASQQEKAIKFIESQDWDLVDIYVDDGYSAKDLNRPAIKKIMQEAKTEKFDVVVFYKLDRLVRSVASLHTLLQLFDDTGVKIKSVTEVFDTTSAMGRFFLTLVAAMAQWERETISERVSENMAKKARGGERNGGEAPFGYLYIDKKLEIHEEEAILVREMFRLYNSGKGLRAIALYLKQFNVAKDIRTISRMLENPIYCGKVRWGNNSKKLETIITESENIPAIVSEETFNQAQQFRKERTIQGKKATSPFPFSGVLRCARCGASLSGYTKKARGTKHYICINKKNKGTCDLPMFTEKALTKEFMDNLSIDNPKGFLNSLKVDVVDQDDNHNSALLIAEIEKKLDKIKKRKLNWGMLVGDEAMPREQYVELMDGAYEEEQILREQLKELSHQKTSLNPSLILEMAQSIPTLWDTVSEFDRKIFIKELFEKIVVDVPRDYYRAPGKSPSVIITKVEPI
ncbi:site-specific DNA recombinase [Bacillus fengqiuensis]|nr:site-specific DNA recombinase [Bacillus fengqiuensis]